MAWTLYFLVGITVVTVSTAYKCKHSGYTSSDNDQRYNYEYGNQETIGLPASRPYERVNSQSAALTAISYTDNGADEVKRPQLGIAEPTRRSTNGSKVMSWKPYLESRRGQANDNNKIVFPGPTSGSLAIEIPEHCKKLGICDDVVNYPQEQADRIIAELGDTSMFQNDKLAVPDVPDITQRLGPQEENMELCSFQDTDYVFPKAGMDTNGQWHYILNQNPPVQSFKVEICDKDGSACSKIAIIQPGYTARCKQKHTYRNMAVIYNGTHAQKQIKVPSCCSCVASLS